MGGSGMVSDLKAASIETKVSVGARISQLVYSAEDSAARVISNPSGAQLAALAEAEQNTKARPEIVKLQVTADARLRHPDPAGTSFERALTDAHALFLEQLDPWEGPCIARGEVARFDEAGRQLPRDSAPAAGVKTVFGRGTGQAYVEVFLHPLAAPGQFAADERSVRVNVVLSKEACAANGIHDLRSLLAANGRQVFGRYMHLASGGKHTGLGDLNARIKREFSRMLARVRAP